MLFERAVGRRFNENGTEHPKDISTRTTNKLQAFTKILGHKLLPQKKKGPSRRVAKPKAERTRLGEAEMRAFAHYRQQLERLGAEKIMERHDLDNVFHWFFQLTDLIQLGYLTFDRINATHFGSKHERPVIKYSRRATGGYYDHRKREIGISLAMTIEHGQSEFMETLLHELAHMEIRNHSPAFYALLTRIGGSGRKAPRTEVLELTQARNTQKRYPFIVHCPNCGLEGRYRTRRALRYACRACCNQFSGGKFDPRFLLRERATENPLTVTPQDSGDSRI